MGLGTLSIVPIGSLDMVRRSRAVRVVQKSNGPEELVGPQNMDSPVEWGNEFVDRIRGKLLTFAYSLLSGLPAVEREKDFTMNWRMAFTVPCFRQ